MIGRGRRRSVFAAVVATALVVLVATPVHAKTSLEKQIESTQKAANAAVANMTRANAELEKARRDIAKFRAQSASNQARIDSVRNQLKEYAIQEYQKGGAGLRYNTLDDPNKVARTHFLVREVALGSVDRLDSYRVIKQDEVLLQGALEARLRDRTAAVARAKAQRAELNSRLSALNGQLTRQARAARAQRGSANSGRVLAKGPWVCPVQGAKAFSNDWGNPRSGGRRHKGTDIFASPGTPVVAPVSGTATTRSGGLGGLSVYLRGSDGNTYYGAHLSRFGSTGGVSQGQIIGYVGSSGNARGGSAHLHFEIHPGGGAAVNPYPTLRTYC